VIAFWPQQPDVGFRKVNVAETVLFSIANCAQDRAPKVSRVKARAVNASISENQTA
jgi:hypothetical protein